MVFNNSMFWLPYWIFSWKTKNPSSFTPFNQSGCCNFVMYIIIACTQKNCTVLCITLFIRTVLVIQSMDNYISSGLSLIHISLNKCLGVLNFGWKGRWLFEGRCLIERGTITSLINCFNPFNWTFISWQEYGIEWHAC